MTIAPERLSTRGEPLPPRPTNWLLVIVLTAILVVLATGLILLAVRDSDDGSVSGDRINGSGTVTTETREVGGFDGVTLMSAGRIVLTQGSEESLTIEADDNLMAYLKTQVSGGALEISAEKDGRSYNLDPSRDIIFRIGVIDLADLRVFGAGDIEMGSLTTDRLDLAVFGSGDVQIDDVTADELRIEVPGFASIDMAGTVPKLQVSWLGAGDYDGGDLRNSTADLSVVGTATLTVWVTESLDISLTGVGTVEYYGTPAITQRVTGVGTIRSLGQK